jgi:hypothetical protein
MKEENAERRLKKQLEQIIIDINYTAKRPLSLKRLEYSINQSFKKLTLQKEIINEEDDFEEELNNLKQKHVDLEHKLKKIQQMSSYNNFLPFLFSVSNAKVQKKEAPSLFYQEELRSNLNYFKSHQDNDYQRNILETERIQEESEESVTWTSNQDTYCRRLFKIFLEMIGKKFLYSAEIKQLIVTNLSFHLNSVQQDYVKKAIQKTSFQKITHKEYFDISKSLLH